ncbi:outer membrane protein assembly factor [Rhodoferax lacus]|uniref:Outer membrane protein assembly factor n=1 Tax=Rhodoferax lacus TaxID=2184758 RepID=A0A3E1RGU2_9BURK|nr:outer membrane protein assembly factor [Rhodoferax lacus]
MLILCNLTLPVHAQVQAPATAPAVGSGSASAVGFTLQIQAPDDIRNLLQRHLELQRYQVLVDLSDAEIQSLLASAEQDATDLLATLGYFSPEIHITLQRPGATAGSTASAGKVVQIEVLPGTQTRVGAVHLVLEGAVAEDPRAQEQRQSVQDLWTLASGEPFSQAAWDTAKERALKLLLARRYPTARVLDSRAEVHPEEARVDLDLQLDSGPAYRYGKLEVEGNQRYGADLVRRFARLQSGDDYELSQLVEAQQRLTDSGYYDSAFLNLDLGGDPAQATVRAQVKEASMQKAVFGIGASTDSGARISAEHTYNQVPGIDWRAVNKITLARDSKTFASDWTSQPGESRWRWAASALFGQDKVAEIDVNTQRYRVGRFTTEASFDQSYFLQYERTEAVLREIDQSTTNQAFSANYAFALRRFDSTPFPSSGWGLGGELAAGAVLGAGQEPYTRVLLHASTYQPLGQTQANLFARQHAGRMLYRAQLGGVFVDNAANVPFNQLFLTGGDTTVRGYQYQEIGTTHDGILSAESGRYVATGSIEWQRPIVRNGLMTDWESAVFIDTGAVSNRVEEFSFKVGVGVGARWKSPIGPLQIDLAYGVATEALRLHLNVGFVF